jgi:hypothetical protein
MPSSRSHKPKRRYELKERARRLQETRLRITEAAVRLHGTVGPARTTISEVARLAGVRRMTVTELITACNSHWMAQNPPPDFIRWEEIEDPRERCASALREMYSWYREKQGMMGNVIRDAALVPALDSIMAENWWPVIDEMVEVLARGWKPGVEARALLRLVLDFDSWRSLTGSGLDDASAARAASRFVAALARGTD